MCELCELTVWFVSCPPQQLRWNIQEQVFQRYFQQGQKYEEWGKLEEQDTYVL